MPDARDDFAIRHVASLARLRLTPDEETLYGRQLAEILAFARRVLDVDTTSLDSASPAEPGGTALRDDTVRPSLAAGQVLEQVPEAGRGDGMVRVPRVIG